jgi:hypothetical protein
MNQELVRFFVDESGDLSRFDKKGRSLLGQEGVSKAFMLGVLRFDDDIESVTKDFEDLRIDLLNDPCLKSIPSLTQKTKLYFHAKDDCSAVRREVFKLLKKLNAQVQVVIKRKKELIEDSLAVFEHRQGKLSDRDIYKSLVSRLFKPLLHKNDSYNILFATRGKTFNNESLTDALEQAKRNCFNSWGIQNQSLINIGHDLPSKHIGLQIIDYYLWAISRLFEQEDDSYFKVLEDKYSLIWDIDDTREKQYGVYYTKKNKISLDRIKKL